MDIDREPKLGSWETLRAACLNCASKRTAVGLAGPFDLEVATSSKANTAAMVVYRALEGAALDRISVWTLFAAMMQ
jgi:hypothetical protein